MTVTRNMVGYTLTKAMALSDLGISEQPIEWTAAGRGRGGTVTIRLPDTISLNTPITGITSITQRFRVVPFQQIYNAYFSTLPVARFELATISFTDVNILINLNLEDS